MTSKNDMPVLKTIYTDFQEVSRKLDEITELMLQCEAHTDAKDIERMGARAGWSRFITQAKNYERIYGLKYLDAQK